MVYWNRIQSGFGSPWGGGWMEWEAGLINRIEQLSIMYTLMCNYYNGGSSMGEFARSHDESQINVVVSILTLLNEED